MLIIFIQLQAEHIESYKLDYVTVQAAPVLRKKQPSKLSKYAVRSLIGGGAIYLAARSYQTKSLSAIYSNPRLILELLPKINLSSLSRTGAANSGFWKGFATASAVSTALFGAFSIVVQNALEVNTQFTKFTPRKKPAYVIHRKKPAPTRPPVLHPREFRKFPLALKEKISPNVYRFTFSLPRDDDILGLPIGQHVAIRADINGVSVTRSYTPTSNDTDLGKLVLVVKVYPGGLITNYLANLNVGDEVEFRGPKGAMKYHRGLCKHIGMIAGGTGITPMYQLIRSICEDDKDDTKVSLLYANQTVDDILLRDELDEWQRKHPNKFTVHYVLNKAPEVWEYSVGFVTKELIAEKFHTADKDTKAMLCGPPGMVNAMKNNLVELGFEKPGAVSKATDQVFVF